MAYRQGASVDALADREADGCELEKSLAGVSLALATVIAASTPQAKLQAAKALREAAEAVHSVLWWLASP